MISQHIILIIPPRNVEICPLYVVDRPCWIVFLEDQIAQCLSSSRARYVTIKQVVGYTAVLALARKECMILHCR